MTETFSFLISFEKLKLKLKTVSQQKKKVPQHYVPLPVYFIVFKVFKIRIEV